MQITGTHFNYYMICHRKLWLFSNNIQMEHSSDLVSEGKLIHETTYNNRSEKFEEVEMHGIKIDYYDTKNRIIHEIKKSSKHEKSHILQLKYYIYVLTNAGIKDVSGILEYPKERKTEEVYLSEADIKQIKEIKTDISKIINQEKCPQRIDIKRCKNCSYYDFCWINEEPDSK